MEINTSQIKTVTLEGIRPTGVISVEGNPNTVNNTDTRQVKNDDISKEAGNLQVAVSQINDYVQNLQRNLQFTIDEATGKDVVTIIDNETKEVIRQIPGEEALELARRLAENIENGVQIVSAQV